MKKAKVITLKVKMSKNRFASLVVTVDPSVTPEMVYTLSGIRGKLIKSETSKTMPLPLALAHSFRLRMKLGIA